MSTCANSNHYRASNGIFYRIEGEGEPLLLLHGVMASGRMFNPLIDLLRNRFRMLVPDLRGHGNSGHMDGPYDVPALASDLDVVMAEAQFGRTAVMGYSHGGAVAQQLAHTRPAAVSKLQLGCTYACNVSTPRERIETGVFLGLLRVLSPATVAKLLLWASKPKPGGAVGLTTEQTAWLQSILAANRASAMRGAFRGLITFDSCRPIGRPCRPCAGVDSYARACRSHARAMTGYWNTNKARG
jgi:pimeloyl-ACP methyl ester carboxylesterase